MLAQQFDGLDTNVLGQCVCAVATAKLQVLIRNGQIRHDGTRGAPISARGLEAARKTSLTSTIADARLPGAASETTQADAFVGRPRPGLKMCINADRVAEESGLWQGCSTLITGT